jgi:hypothetical protein
MTSHVLRKALKPVVDFDVQNKEHRKLFHEFLSSGSWRHCPIVFSVKGQYNDCVRMISTQLLKNYLEKEFRNAKND